MGQTKGFVHSSSAHLPLSNYLASAFNGRVSKWDKSALTWEMRRDWVGEGGCWAEGEWGTSWQNERLRLSRDECTRTHNYAHKCKLSEDAGSRWLGAAAQTSRKIQHDRARVLRRRNKQQQQKKTKQMLRYHLQYVTIDGFCQLTHFLGMRKTIRTAAE